MSRNTAVTSVPVRIKDSDGNLIRINSDNAFYGTYLGCVQLITDYPSAGDRYRGALLNNSTNSTSIGTMTDTVQNSAVLDPITTINSTTTTLYQLDDALITLGDQVLLSSDSDGHLYQMNDTEQIGAAALLGYAYSNEWPGVSFRLASTSPSPTSDWEVWQAGVFTNTEQDESDIGYNLYRRKAITWTTGSATHGHGVYKSVVNGKVALREGEQEQVGRTYYRGFDLRRASLGVGRYLLLPSGSTPSSEGEAGTWAARGSAIDTRKATVSMQFTGTRPATFTGQRNFAATYAGQRDAAFTGITAETNFLGARNFTATYVGQRDAIFAGSAAATFTGQRNFTATYAGQRDAAFTGITAETNFAGTAAATFTGQRNFAATYAGQRDAAFTGAANYAGTRPADYTGPRDAQFAGSRDTDVGFAGTRAANYAGTRPANYTGFRAVNFAGPNAGQQFATAGQFGSVTSTALFSTQYSGTRSGATYGKYTATTQGKFAGPVTGIGYYSSNFAGQRIFVGPRQVNYLGSRPANFAGTAAQNFAGTVAATFTGQRNFTATYAGQRDAAFTGITAETNFAGTAAATFTGQRNFAATYAGQRDAAFTGAANYAGTRPADYTGPRDAQFAGSRDTDVGFAGTRPANYTGQRDAQFVGYSSTETNFAGTRPADYTGPRDAQFDGSRDTDVDFAGTRAAQFAGQGVGDTQTTVETYTLYVRTA